MENLFSLGEIVTFKTHPLLYDFMVKGDGKFIPPMMVVKEIFFETKKKKIVDESSGKIIADRIKYTCIYFDDNKSEFKEVVIYKPMLDSFKNMHIARLEGKKSTDKESLRSQVLGYKKVLYEYGKEISFKTKKIEMYKKRSSKKPFFNQVKKVVEMRDVTLYEQCFFSPEFIICGYKKDTPDNLFYSNGDKRRIVSIEFFKVKWYNPSLRKFSEQFVPIECFVDVMSNKSNITQNDESE